MFIQCKILMYTCKSGSIFVISVKNKQNIRPVFSTIAWILSKDYFSQWKPQYNV